MDPVTKRANVSRSEEDEARSSSKHRAALEALFAKKSEPKQECASATGIPSSAPDTLRSERASARRVQVAPKDDPRREEREMRVAKLVAADGRVAVTKAADELIAAGFALPATQDVLLALLEHADGDRVLTALGVLDRVLDGEPPARRPVLEARLRRLEDNADDDELRGVAARVRRKLFARSGR